MRHVLLLRWFITAMCRQYFSPSFHGRYFWPVRSGVRPLDSTSRFESTQRVSAMNGKFYYTEVNMYVDENFS